MALRSSDCLLVPVQKGFRVFLLGFESAARACVLKHGEERLHCACCQNLVATADGVTSDVAEGPHCLDEDVRRVVLWMKSAGNVLVLSRFR